MANKVTVYSAANTILNFAGHVLEGLAEGDDVIKVERLAPGNTIVVGIQGDGVINQTTDKSARITVKLLKGSDSNKFLSDKYNAGEIGFITSAPFIITEVGNDGKVTAKKTIIEKMPDLTRGSSAAPIEWTFISFDCAVSHSGSESI
jgi:hypothetical protein